MPRVRPPSVAPSGMGVVLVGAGRHGLIPSVSRNAAPVSEKGCHDSEPAASHASRPSYVVVSPAQVCRRRAQRSHCRWARANRLLHAPSGRATRAPVSPEGDALRTTCKTSDPCTSEGRGRGESNTAARRRVARHGTFARCVGGGGGNGQGRFTCAKSVTQCSRLSSAGSLLHRGIHGFHSLIFTGALPSDPCISIPTPSTFPSHTSLSPPLSALPPGRFVAGHTPANSPMPSQLSGGSGAGATGVGVGVVLLPMPEGLPPRDGAADAAIETDPVDGVCLPNRDIPEPGHLPSSPQPIGVYSECHQKV